MKKQAVLQLAAFLIAICLTGGARAELSFKDKLYDDYGIDLLGFVEARQGWRLQDDPNEDDMSISEARLQLEASKDLEWGYLNFKGDLVGDLVEEEVRAELRSLNLLFSPLDNMDVRAGRQVLTWGTGDLLFINDLFAKDWVSFFVGRDDEYLKAPSDALRTSMFFDAFNVDLAYIPIANTSEYIDGSRLSYYNPMLGEVVGEDNIAGDDDINSFPNDGEVALRLYRALGSTEVALYGFYGFWKTPEGFRMDTGELYYPRLSAYGASVRSPMLGGIASLEAGYYDSKEDDDGDDPTVRNSEVRFLSGFERELARDFTGGFQYYLEWMQDYDEYESTATGPKKDEFRHVFTLRLTKLLMNQTLKLSFFAYYSPSDKDTYIRPKIHYKLTDAWALETGANIFVGEDDHTFFGQFEDNTNAYASVRRSF